MALPRRLVLLGSPVEHSLSPTFQNAALRAAGIPLVYEARDVPPERLEAELAALVAEGAAGNVTIPHKERVWELCDRRSGVAERTGAVNVFWVEDGRLVGDNTDVEGFDALAAGVLGAPAAGRRLLLLGAGGAAAAVLAAVERWPAARVTVHARTPERARALCARFPALARQSDDVREAAREADVVVNATPLGLRDTDPFPLALELLPRESTVLDLVYRPGGTAWVRAARTAGHPAADGLAMLVAQGAAAFERWFGRAPDLEAMWRSMR